jgi:hypothetical protein
MTHTGMQAEDVQGVGLPGLPRVWKGGSREHLFLSCVVSKPHGLSRDFHLDATWISPKEKLVIDSHRARQLGVNYQEMPGSGQATQKQG